MSLLFQCLQTLVLPTRWRWVPGGLAIVVVVGCLKVGAFQSAEYLAYNAFVKWRGQKPWHDDIVVIEIDDKTLENVGEFPLSRRYYARILDFLTHAESGVVVIGVVFSEPSPDDAHLAQAMSYHGQVVLAQAWNREGVPVFPTQALYDHSIHSGHVLNYPDSDGVTRSVRPYVQGIPSLGIAALQASSLNQNFSQNLSQNLNQNLNQAWGPTPTESQVFWVNWPGAVDQLQRYSFLDVLQQTVDGDRFRNKLVIIGSGVAGVDPIATPFNQDPPATGIDLHAVVLTNLLSGNQLTVTTTSHKALILLLGGPLLSLWLSSWNMVRRWFVGTLCLCLWLGIALFLLKINIWLPIVWPTILIALSTGLTEMSARLKANADLQQEVARLWQAYHRDVLLYAGKMDDSSPLFPMRSLNPQHRFSPLSFWLQGFYRQDQHTQPVSVQRTQQLTTLIDVFGRSQALHGAIARSLSIGLVAINWDGLIWFCNPAATHFLGVTSGHSLPETLVPHWLNQPTWEQYLHNLHQGQSIRWEHCQDEQWFEMRLEPLFQSPEAQEDFDQRRPASPYQPRLGPHPSLGIIKEVANDLVGALLLVEDITTYKQVEVEVRNALAQEKEFNELKSRFVSMVSHELRTPLTIIRTSIEMLERQQRSALSAPSSGSNLLPSGERSPDKQRQSVAERQQKYCKRINNAVSTMTQLLEDVLMLGQVESKKLDFKPQYMDCVEACHTIIDDMQVQPLGHPRIIFNHQGRDRTYYLDPYLLKIILSNLLSNAMKYSPEHTEVSVHLECGANQIHLQVEDHGIGIPIDSQQQLFEEFQRATNVGTIPGTGLGLSIVKRCVDLHGGKILVESSVDVGSTFFVSLPSRPSA